jgi:hypothetical protein
MNKKYPLSLIIITTLLTSILLSGCPSSSKNIADNNDSFTISSDPAHSDASISSLDVTNTSGHSQSFTVSTSTTTTQATSVVNNSDPIAIYNGSQSWCSTDSCPDSCIINSDNTFSVDSGNFCILYAFANPVPGLGVGDSISGKLTVTNANGSNSSYNFINRVALYAGGDFTSTVDGKATIYNIAKWDGDLWDPLASGLNDTVWALAADSAGTIYVGGDFTKTNDESQTLPYIGKWLFNASTNSGNWSAINESMSSGTPNIGVRALEVDQQNNLYVGGSFNKIEDNDNQEINTANIAKWSISEQSWSPLNGGLGDPSDPNNFVLTIAVDHNDTVYAGGSFSRANDSSQTPIANVAKWNSDTQSWQQAGNGISDGVVVSLTKDNNNIYASIAGIQIFPSLPYPHISKLAIQANASWQSIATQLDDLALVLNDYDNTLYAGGVFTAENSSPLPRFNHIAQWDGSNWSGLGNGIEGNGSQVMAIVKDQAGNIFAGGYFHTTDSNDPIQGIAKWNGSEWVPVGGGIDGEVNALLVQNQLGLMAAP